MVHDECTCEDGGHPALCSNEEHVKLWMRYMDYRREEVRDRSI